MKNKYSIVQDSNILDNYSKDWDLIAFMEAIEDVSSGNEKLKKSEYKEEGELPIVDQGKSLIAGYTDEKFAVSENPPYIVFGDHTRIFKYINFKISIGADGVKLLKLKPDYEEKIYYEYLYYFFTTLNIPDTGYNRHFKYLKEVIIPLPSLDEQKEIVAKLDRAQRLIDIDREMLVKYDELIQSVFLDMFGDPVTNPKGWKVKRLEDIGDLKSGGTPPRKNKEYFSGEINWYTTGELNGLYLDSAKEKITQNAIEESSAKLFQKGSLLIGMYDTSAFKLGVLTRDASSNQACANILLKNDVCIVEWLYFCLKIMRPAILHERRGIRQKNLSLGFIKKLEIMVPPLREQEKYYDKLSLILEEKTGIKSIQMNSKKMFSSLIQRAFTIKGDYGRGSNQ